MSKKSAEGQRQSAIIKSTYEELAQKFNPVIARAIVQLAKRYDVLNRRMTREAAKAAVSSASGKKFTIAAVVSEIDRVLKPLNQAILEARRYRRPRPSRNSNAKTTRSYRLPRGTLVERHEKRLKDIFWRAVQSSIRYGAAGGSSFELDLTDDPGKIDYEVNLESNRDTYRGHYKGWLATEDHHKAVIHKKWLNRVHRRGLAVVDGLATLDAIPLEGAPDGVELFEAVWIVQGRGYKATAEQGFIARSNGFFYHGSTITGALSGLKRKIRHAKWDAALSDNALMAELASRYSGLSVKIADAVAVGACDPGIRTWCARVGLNYADQEAAIEEVLAAYRRLPWREAKAAILYALRRRGARISEKQQRVKDNCRSDSSIDIRTLADLPLAA